MLRRQRAIEIVPSSEPFRWRRYDVPQHLAPETSDALRFCAVEGDLELLDRRHRSTIEARPSRRRRGSGSGVTWATSRRKLLNVGHLCGWRVDPRGCWQRGWLGDRANEALRVGGARGSHQFPPPNQVVRASRNP